MGSEFPSHEFALLDTLKPLLNFTPSATYPFGIGDDTTLRACKKGERLVLTADTAIQDVHFSLRYMGLDEIGYRAMATNLSDCAAAGAVPDAALVQVVFPKKNPGLKSDFKKLYHGFFKACQAWNFPIIGGDVSSGPCWMIAITLIGKSKPDQRYLRRKGIKPLDNLWVSGCPGESAAGLCAIQHWGRSKIPSRFRPLVKAHINPVPQLALGQALSHDPHVHAAIDISDGAGKECRTLCYENKTGLILDIPRDFPSTAILQLSQELKADWLRWFFGGGEDYQLLFAADKKFDGARLGKQLGIKLRCIGQFTAKSTEFSAYYQDKKIGSQIMLGWDHIS